MAYITQNQFDTVIQPFRNTYAKINLLNFQFLTVDSLEGVVTECNISISADADVRRTCNVTMVVKDSSFNVEAGGKIWLDKYIQVFSGIEDVLSGEIVWTNQGIYLINNPNHVFDATNNTISFQGVDLMSKLTGLRNGYANAMQTIIPIGSNIRDVMIETLALGGFTKYTISDNPQSVPYEIVVEKTATLYEILKKLRDISPEYEMFFDINGVFVYQLIPSGADDPIMLDNTALDKTLISISNQVSFESVKNHVQLFGKALAPNYYGGEVSPVGDTYTVSIANISTLAENLMFGFTAVTTVANPKLKLVLNGTTYAAYPIVNEDGTPAVLPANAQYYVVRYLGNGTFLYMGKQQISAVAEDDNPDSPFYVNGSTGRISVILSGGDYDNIVTDDLAQQRANYELYLRARLQDSITITSVPIPWLDVNMKMRYTNETMGLDGTFLIKTISMSLVAGGTMTINGSRFYPLYPYIKGAI